MVLGFLGRSGLKLNDSGNPSRTRIGRVSCGPHLLEDLCNGLEIVGEQMGDRTQRGIALDGARRHLQWVAESYGDTDWRRDHKGFGEYPEDHLWWATKDFSTWTTPPGSAHRNETFPPEPTSPFLIRLSSIDPPRFS